MQKKVQRKEVDLKITSDNSPSRLKANPSPVKGSPAKDNSAYGLPNPDILAQKYGLPREGLSLADQYSAEAYNGPPIEEYEAAIKTMKGKIDEKNRKIEHLCVLLEALEPAPGVDPARLQAIVQDRIPDEQIDIRDGKIVSLAKKSHRLTMQLIKERSVNDRLSEELEESRRKNDSLTQEMQLLRAAEHVNGNILRQENKTYNRNAMAAAATSKKEAEDTTSTVNIQKQLRDQAKSIDELRIQVKELHDENKSLTRALTREVGEGVSVEQAVDGGWRGRAQQIILLRAKVKQLEAALGSGGGNLNSGSTMTFRSNMGGGGGSTVNGGRGMDVDARAAEDINEMSRERRQVVEALTEERVRLMEQNQALEKKNNGTKARVQVLENEMRKLRESLQVALDKSNTDDQLVDALRDEIQRLQGRLRTVEENANIAVRKVQQMNRGEVSGTLSESAAKEQQYQAEIQRLQRLNKNQSEQLDSQDVTIRQLRKKVSS